MSTTERRTGRAINPFVRWLTGPAVLRFGGALLRRFAPVASFRGTVLVARHADVIDALTRDTDFTIREINGPKIDALDGPFILGMDRGSDYEREAAMLQAVVRRDDVARIRDMSIAHSAELIARAAPAGKLDVVGGLARVVPTRLVGEYFGTRGPDDATLQRWLRDAFFEVFLNATNNADAHATAMQSGAELRAWQDAEIARRKPLVRAAGRADDMMGRMILLQSDPAYAWLDDRSIRRNLGGVIVGAVDTTSWLVNVALDELFKRPAELQKAAAAARANDLDTVRSYAYEAARFHPPTPFLVRYVPRDTTLGGHKVKAGKRLFAMLVSAMFDPAAWPDPGAFRIDRQSKHLHFGHGMHQCYGTRINDVQIPAILAAVLRLPNLRRAGSIEWDGPFPNRFMVAFDPH